MDYTDDNEFSARTWSELAADIAALATLREPSGGHDGADTVLVFPGHGETARLQQAAMAVAGNSFLWNLIVAGDNPDNSHHEIIQSVQHLEVVTGVRIPHFCGEPVSHRAVFQEAARNTLEQAQWAYAELLKCSATGVRLYVSDYHAPRALMTLIEQMLQSGRCFKIYPQPTYPLYARSPGQVNQQGHDLLSNEMLKILQYRRLGHVASSNLVRAYVDWVQRQTLPPEDDGQQEPKAQDDR